MSSTRKFQGCDVMLRAAVLGFMVLCVCTPALLSQYREIPLPYRDTTRVKVQFLDSLHGWVVNYRGTILRTTDGGVQWTEHHFTADSTIDDLEFVDQRNGWLLFSTRPPGSNSSVHRLYTTSDAGASWVKVPIFPDTMRPTARPNGGYWRTPFSRIVPARNIEFVDSNTVYMESASRKSIMFWRTTNRGQTWEELRNAAYDATPFNQTIHHLEVLDSLHWFIVHTYPLIQTPLPVIVTTTSDGGGTWEITGYWDDEIVFNVCQSGPLMYTIFPRPEREISFPYAHTKYTMDGGNT
ncbi:MAG: hypothetical protein HY962_05495, partial [Ignavibacteriae bacterium]|nr:hypothetical protein [Ignavibacteriota bacterium]